MRMHICFTLLAPGGWKGIRIGNETADAGTHRLQGATFFTIGGEVHSCSLCYRCSKPGFEQCTALEGSNCALLLGACCSGKEHCAILLLDTAYTHAHNSMHVCM